MGLPNYWQGTRGIMPLLIIRLVCWLGWFSSFAFAQFDISEGVTGSVNFPTLGITCIANLAVFVTSVIRQWIDVDIGATHFIDILASPKLINIYGMNGHGLTTMEFPGDADVVMLSNGAPNSSMTEFIKSNANRVNFILLQFIPLRSTSEEIKTCPCRYCDCIVFYTVEEITKMLALRMPGTLKLLSDGLCLLPSLICLENGCHGCTEESKLPLPVEQSHEGYKLRETDSKVVCGILDTISVGFRDSLVPTCICIPMKDARSDEWTMLLVKSLRSKDAEGRGVRDSASQVLENYLAAAGRGGEGGRVEYKIASFIMTRLTEVSINLLLTFFLGVDGFSSAVVARRTVREYLVDSKGSGFAANAFLSEARVKCNESSTQVCQVLRFRGNIVGMRTLSIIVGCVNLVSSLGWTVLIALKGSADISPPLSMPRVAVIIAAIGIILAMDLSAFYFYFRAGSSSEGSIEGHRPHSISFCSSSWRFLFDRRVFVTVIILEIVCLVSGSVVAGTLGVKAFGRWVYGVVQALVWVKWGFCSYLLDKYGWRLVESPLYFVGSSAFFLNAVLAGVRCKWEPGPWKFH